MKIGIFGSQNDSQCIAVKQHLENLGAETVIVESQALNNGEPFSFDGDDFYYHGKSLKDVGAWYLRYISSPSAPVFSLENEYLLYRDWFIDYMRQRENSGFQLSLLLYLSLKGIPVVNPPEHGGVVQLKPFQLAAAKSVGLTIPKTLITNSPTQVKEFIKNVGNVVYKPSMGGGLCHIFVEEDYKRLDDITSSPVTFQECIDGTCVRVTIVGDKIISSVLIPSNYLDYRADPNYNSGGQTYEHVELPEEIMSACLKLLKTCGLLFSGVDFILRSDGKFIFIEANSSPIYLDIEQKTKDPISRELALYLIKIANYPNLYKESLNQAKRTKTFVSYAYPFNPDISIGGPYERE